MRDASGGGQERLPRECACGAPPRPAMQAAESRGAGAYWQHSHRDNSHHGLGELELIDLSNDDYNGSLLVYFNGSWLRLLNALVAKEEDQLEGGGGQAPSLPALVTASWRMSACIDGEET
jgi:hypothetical protein